MSQTETETHPLSVAALLLGGSWKLDQHVVPIAPGITITFFGEGRIHSRYKDLRRTWGIDPDGSIDYEFALILEPPVEYLLDFGPGSPLRLLCGLFEIMSANVVSMCRVLWSTDSFLSTSGTSLVFSYGNQTEFLETCANVDRPLVEDIAAGWKVLQPFVKKQGYMTRIMSALVQFSWAGHSSLLERTAIHMELALRILFNTVNKEVTAAEIASCVERILGQSNFGGDDIATLVRETVGVQRQLVRHGCLDQNRICEYVPQAYRLTAAVLRKVLLDRNLASAFNAFVTA